MKFATKAVHVGQEPDPATGSVIPPIYQTSTFAIKDPQQENLYEYTRHGNPNYHHLEQTLASLEQARFATVFCSGMGGATGLTALLESGDRVVSVSEVYGGTYRLFAEVLSRFRITHTLVPSHDEDAIAQALEPPTRLLLFETPTNPHLHLVDIEKMATLAKNRDVLVAVDNTFASPYLQNPLSLGADIVWHSTTKYIGGHSDLMGGALVTNDLSLKKRFDHARMTLGLNPGPFDAWLTSRGVKTLALRMQQHEKNAMAMATFFNDYSQVKQVYYPGLSTHPQHELAKRQMRGFGGMLSVEFDADYAKTLEIVHRLRLFTLAISLGGVESLVNHSASMSHAALPAEERKRLGITDSLVRFSAGIEATEDLIEDISQAML
ncbi:MAG: cystathionine gamma-synthase [Chlamydiales bacterium]